MQKNHGINLFKKIKMAAKSNMDDFGKLFSKICQKSTIKDFWDYSTDLGLTNVKKKTTKNNTFELANSKWALTTSSGQVLKHFLIQIDRSYHP
jgi:hypothetical protein